MGKSLFSGVLIHEVSSGWFDCNIIEINAIGSDNVK